MNVRSLSTTEEFQRYVDFTQEVYRENPHWVPPDAHHLTKVWQVRPASVPSSRPSLSGSKTAGVC